MKQIISIVGLVFALSIMVWAFLPSPIPAEVAIVERGLFRQVIEDDGKTRPVNTYMITSPVIGNLTRVTFKAGDHVEKGELLAKIIPATSKPLDVREELQLEERKGAAESALSSAKVNAARAKASYDNAVLDHKRAAQLAKKGFVSESELDKLTLNVELRKKEHESALHNVDSAEHDLKRTKYALKHFKRAYEPQEESTDSAIDVTSPISGEIIKVQRESRGAIKIGETIMEVADTRNVEIVTDILSSEVVKIPKNAEVIIKRWGGDKDLKGRVRHVEPGGFTKISALGVEEQRVNVITDITSPREEWENLRVGFQLDTEIVLYTLPDQLLVPVSALFRDGKDWAVFLLDGSVVRKRIIKIKARNPDVAVVESGLQVGDKVVMYPGDRIDDGVRVKASVSE